MKKINIFGILLLTFIVGVLVGFDFGQSLSFGSRNMMNQKHFRVFDRSKNYVDYIDYYYSTQEPRDTYVPRVNKGETPVAPVTCTMEAKICPDGSSVGRQGPNCEFAPCPN